MDSILNELKIQLGYGNISINNIKELEKIHVKKNDVRNYNTTFTSLLNGIEPSERPPESIIINYYIRGLEQSISTQWF